MEHGGNSRKKYAISKPRTQSKPKTALKDEEIVKELFPKPDEIEDSDVECLDSEEHRSARNEQAAKKSKLLMEKELDDKLTKMGIPGLDNMPMEEKEQLLNVLEESKQSAKSEPSFTLPEDEVTIDDDNDFILTKKPKNMLTRTMNTRNARTNTLRLRHPLNKVCYNQFPNEELGPEEISKLRKRGVEVTQNDDDSLPRIPKKPVATISSQGASTTLVQNFSEESLQFDPTFPYPEEKSMPMPEWRIQMQKQNFKNSIYYVPDNIVDGEARMLCIQKNLDEHTHTLIEYHKKKVIALKDVNNEPKWVTIPSMTEYETRMFYKNRKAIQDIPEECLAVPSHDKIKSTELSTEPDSSTFKFEISSVQSDTKNEESRVVDKVPKSNRLSLKRSTRVKKESENCNKWLNKEQTKPNISNSKGPRGRFYDGTSQLLSNPFEKPAHSTSNDTQNLVVGAKKRKNDTNPQNSQQSESDTEDQLQLNVLSITDDSKKLRSDSELSTQDENMIDDSQVHSPVF